MIGRLARLFFLPLGLFTLVVTTVAQEPTDKGKDVDPDRQWGLMGNDDSVLSTIKESDEVVLACVYQITYTDRKYQRAYVHMEFTVAHSYKGALKPGDKATLSFPAEFRSTTPKDLDREMAEMRKSNLGVLRFCFLRKPEKEGDKEYGCDFTTVPQYSAAMEAFLQAYCGGRK